jgi:4-diphosphocytidyl-2-C-methyl-D-erythritol kinase
MQSEQCADALVVWAPAKVNLFLEVLGKRTDGYHDIASLMVAVTLYDTLEFKEATPADVWLDGDHPGLAMGPDNLICRAAALLKQHTGCQRGARLWLRKRIPLAAGLAGGSSDAAATLLGLNRLWALGLGKEELTGLAADIGSDVAFFLDGAAAWCTGRGELVKPLALGSALWFVLACPIAGLATGLVYQNLAACASPENGEQICKAFQDGRVEDVGRLLHNRLQAAAQELCPEVATLNRRLKAARPVGHLMSGSGTTVFALCRDRQEAFRIAGELRDGAEDGTRPRVWIVRSCC